MRGIWKFTVKPDIEDFLLVSFSGNWSAPLEIPGYAALLHALREPRLGDLLRVVSPIDLRLFDPFLKLRLQLVQVDENMLWLPNDGGGFANHALWVKKLDGIKQLTTGVALVTLGFRVAAQGTRAPHEAVGQRSVTLGAEALFDLVLEQIL